MSVLYYLFMISGILIQHDNLTFLKSFMIRHVTEDKGGPRILFSFLSLVHFLEIKYNEKYTKKPRGLNTIKASHHY